MSFLYFAYGSNLLRERIHVNNPSAVFVTVAKLMNYSLRFCVQHHWNEDTSRWRGGAATIEESPGESLCGIVWKLENSDLESLDKQEGVPNVYRRLNNLKVISTTDDSELECISYQFVEPRFTRPSPQYVNVLKMGSIQNNMSKDYQQYLDSIEHNGYAGPLAIYDEIMKNAKM